VTLVPWDDSSHHVSADGSSLKRASFESLDPEHLENLDELTGYTWNIYHVPYLTGKRAPGPLTEIPDYFFRTIDLVKAKVGDEVSVHSEVFSPFTHYMELLGYEQALMGLVTDRGKAHALLDRLAEAAITWARAQARHGVDAVLISSAFAGGGFISRKMYSEFVVPYERRVTEAVKADGVPVYTHTCGKIGDRLDLMAETGTQGVDTLDPPPLGNVELAKAKQLIGDRLFIKGNMNSAALLAYQTKEEVIAEATRCLRDGAPGGGYILSTACSVAPRVEPWKLELLTPLAEEIGKY
jgi:MtaA/CmuA family methyltransferase